MHYEIQKNYKGYMFLKNEQKQFNEESSKPESSLHQLRLASTHILYVDKWSTTTMFFVCATKKDKTKKDNNNKQSERISSQAVTTVLFVSLTTHAPTFWP
jgi:hypothetical protein